MPVRIELLTEIVLWLIISVLTLTAVSILVMIQRRVNRRRYFQELDLARQTAKEIADRFFQKKGNVDDAVAAFLAFRSKAERQALEEALYRHTKLPEEIAMSRIVVQKMGRIQEWVDTLRSRARKPSGEAARLLVHVGDDYHPPRGLHRLRLRFKSGFLTRALAANKLGRVPTPEGVCAFIAGLADPHPDVQEICIRHLGNSGDPDVLPVLLEELLKVLNGQAKTSVRSIKTALVQFPLEVADRFVPVLEGSNRRARFFAVDVLREISDRRAATHGLLNKNDFSPTIYNLFLKELCHDEWGDVRARSAAVIAHFHDPISYKILEKLSQDEEWFVRLHACRSVASKFFLPLAPALAQRLTDKHWLVREAAVRSLLEMGDLGTEQIVQTFLTSDDRYTSEQVSEELQRSGLLITLLDSIGEPHQHTQVHLVIRKMISINKFAMLLAYLLSPVPPVRKLLLIKELSSSMHPDCQQALSVCAATDPDPRVARAAIDVLESHAATLAETSNV